MDTIPNETKIIINVKIKENSTINYRNFPIFFDIILNPPLQISEPEVLCKSNFCFPSLYNNKNLLKCVCDKYNVRIPIIKRINSIIINFSYFINYYEILIKKYKILFYLGEYNMKRLYNVNDFLLNNNNKIFKLKTDFFSKKNYINIFLIITDYNIILIKPSEKFKNRGTIFYIGNLIDVSDIHIIKSFENEEGIQNILFKFIINENVNYLKFYTEMCTDKKTFKKIANHIQEKVKNYLNKFFIIFPLNLKMNYIKLNGNLIKILKLIVNYLKIEYKKYYEKNVLFLKHILILIYDFLINLTKLNNDKENFLLFSKEIKEFNNI